MGLDQHVLRDVASIDPPGEHGVHSQADHLPHRRPVPRQQSIDCLGVARANVVQQCLRVL
jgi:hypothetical protein